MGKTRAGRRRRVDAEREPNGRTVKRSPEERERDAMAVALGARLRHGLTPSDVRKVEAESAIGQALLRRYIDLPRPDQRERILLAAAEYEKLSRDYHAVLGAKQMGSASDYDRQPSYDGSEGDDPAYIEHCVRVRSRWRECRSELLRSDPMALFAVQTWVIEGKPAMGMIGPLLVGLNALAKLLV